MPSLVGLRRRIKSAKNISQITKAMEMVSASKMKKAQDQSHSTHPFSEKLTQIIARLSTSGSASSHPLLRTTDNPKHAMLIIVSTDKGLCGPLNVNLFRSIAEWSEKVSPHQKIDVVHVRKRAKTTVHADKSPELLAVFHDISENPTFTEARSIAKLALDSFTAGQVDEVFIAYPKFISTLVSQPTIKKILPLTSFHSDAASSALPYTIEPSSSELLSQILPYMVEMITYQILIDASAAEQSARMVAMKNASDNAKDLISSLTLDYNQARQSQVTSQLLDATIARMALE